MYIIKMDMAQDIKEGEHLFSVPSDIVLDRIVFVWTIKQAVLDVLL